MTLRIYRAYQAVILAICGFVLLIKILSGDLRLYIGPEFLLLFLFASILLLALAQNLLGGRKLYPQPVSRELTHEESRSLITGLLIMLLPLLIGLSFSGKPLGALALTKRGVQQIVPFKVSPADRIRTFGIPESNWNILDWMIVAQTVEETTSYNGDPISITGLVYMDQPVTGDQFILARFLVNCCQTEAVAIGIPIEWSVIQPLVTGEWVSVQGRVEILYPGQKPQIMIRADSVTPIPAPDQPYVLFR